MRRIICLFCIVPNSAPDFYNVHLRFNFLWEKTIETPLSEKLETKRDEHEAYDMVNAIKTCYKIH